MKATLILTLGLLPVLPAAAAPRADNIPAEPPAPPEEVAELEARAPALGDPEPKGVGFLGVSAQPLPPFRARELKLKQGVSLTTVMAGTPAAKAGLQVGDVITKIGVKEIGTMEELSDAIQAHKEGDRITLTVLQEEGKEVKKRVTLAARPAPPAGAMQGGAWPQFRPLMGGGLRLNFAGGAGLLRIGDAEGSVELTGRGEAREVVVRDQNDEVVFEGPWVTPQDKAAAPPRIKQRIDRIAGIFGDDGFGGLDMALPQIAPLGADDEELKPPMLERKAPDGVAPGDETPEPDPAP